MASFTRLRFRVECGVWQSRQTVCQFPYRPSLPLLEWLSCAWQSMQSWLDESRTRIIPVPVPAARTRTWTQRASPCLPSLERPIPSRTELARATSR